MLGSIHAHNKSINSDRKKRVALFQTLGVINTKRNVKIIKYISFIYIAVLLCCVLLLFVLESERLETGCYISNALVAGAKCNGFYGSNIVSFIINMPLNLIYAPIFGIASLFQSPFYMSGLYTLLTGFLLWLPIVFLIIDKLHNKTPNKSFNPDGANNAPPG